MNGIVPAHECHVFWSPTISAGSTHPLHNSNRPADCASAAALQVCGGCVANSQAENLPIVGAIFLITNQNKTLKLRGERSAPDKIWQISTKQFALPNSPFLGFSAGEWKMDWANLWPQIPNSAKLTARNHDRKLMLTGFSTMSVAWAASMTRSTQQKNPLQSKLGITSLQMLQRAIYTALYQCTHVPTTHPLRRKLPYSAPPLRARNGCGREIANRK